MPYRKDRIKKLIGFTPEEWEVVCKKAKAANLRVGTYIKAAARGWKIKVYDLHEIMALKRAFYSIGNNVNQIAKKVNTQGSVYKEDIEALQKEFKYFNDAMNNYMFEITPTFIV